ncbi:MAG: HAD family hydrolase [Sulfurovum sp.]|nr:HAD family hydrolase [Sulfurovum sp.]MCB4746170.1 HAD family hydrolase [Sulfurovum sp.]MCB4747924.1 HAD family hydrolase [Sulfurovum sp.]MCB4749076.1 HAD family hydrolase [Sulfurovum sp.]MCB4750447.1 HAD family hydrolase [Sulfurovum sp.]
MVNKELIIFDMDGTLVNSSTTIANAINYVRQQLGFEPMDTTYILSKVNDHTVNPAQIFYHAKTFQHDHERWFSEYYTKYHNKELVLYEGIKALLESLRHKGFKLAIATNAYRRSTIESLTYLNIYTYFDAITCYDDVRKGKPYPDMLLKLLNGLNISKEKTLFIGDGPRDEQAAKHAGIDYIMVDWGFTEHTEKKGVVTSVEILSKYLCSTHKDKYME